jgi:hypothetical protein
MLRVLCVQGMRNGEAADEREKNRSKRQGS